MLSVRPTVSAWRFEMIDRKERFARCERQRLAGNGADDQPADQARAGGSRDAHRDRPTPARLGHGRADDVIQTFGMRTRRDFRHYAAINLVLIELRPHDIGEDASRGPAPSRATTAAAVSSQLVSMPSTSMLPLGTGDSPARYGLHDHGRAVRACQVCVPLALRLRCGAMSCGPHQPWRPHV